jgi:opacity protein-like surface antigen
MPRSNRLAATAAGTLLVAALGAGASAQDGAREPGFYVSGGASYLEFEGDNGVDAEVTGLTGRLGMQFNSWLSLEGDATFGFEEGDFDFQGDEEEFNLDDNSDGDVTDIINAPGEFGLDYMLGAYVKASLPVSDVFDLYGRVGYAYAEVDSNITTPGGSTLTLGDAESGASVGAGAALNFTDRQSVRLDYTFTDFDLAEANALGLMYQFKF